MIENFIDKVFNEGCLQGLRQLPDNIVDCCVTSPPYYALRNYGTGHWEGGRQQCDHKDAKIKTRFDYDISEKQSSNRGTDVQRYTKVCPSCGAIYVDEQIGLEESPEQYIEKLTKVFMEVHRVLKPEGTLWINIGDSYNSSAAWNKNPHGFDQTRPNRITQQGINGCIKTGKKVIKENNLKPKDLIGIPWMLAFSLRNAGWYLRQDIIWHKPNPTPESVLDRCTKSHEYIFLLSKSKQYYFDHEQMQEPATSTPSSGVIGGNKYGKNDDPHFRTFSGKVWTPKGTMRNKRDVWSVNVKGDSIAHFATYPEELIMPCILAGCPHGGLVLDPFMGSGTTARVARKLNRHFVGFELNPDYIELINQKIVVTPSLFD